MYTDCDRDEPNNTDCPDNDISYDPAIKYTPALVAQAPISLDELTFRQCDPPISLVPGEAGSPCADAP
jgi:hypothetical protein